MIETENLEKLILALQNDVYDNTFLPDAIQELEKVKSAVFWKNWVYPKGATAEQVQNELTDYHMILDNVSKVYMEVTGGRISKENTLAREVISEYENHVNDMIEDALEEYKGFVSDNNSEPE